ncbi:MAG: biotin--[acetyl-CoA-carboxylase] ligase [Pseudomonadota bacterium]
MIALWPDGVGRIEVEEVDSTMLEAPRQAAAGAIPPFWLRAEGQSMARGRRGRAWAAPRGNFMATLMMPVSGEPATAALRSFVAALALRDAVAGLIAEPERLTLKWPNDVLLDDRKLAGILLETATTAAGPALLIGIGVNLVTAPLRDVLEAGALPPIALADATPAPPDPGTFLSHLAPAFATWEGRFQVDGFAPVRAAWLASAKGVGETVTARLPNRAITGRFLGLDPTGALLIETPTGALALAAADVHFPEKEGA